MSDPRTPRGMTDHTDVAAIAGNVGAATVPTPAPASAPVPVLMGLPIPAPFSLATARTALIPDHYWLVANRSPDPEGNTNYFSSAQGAYVPETDQGYQDFITNGGMATYIATDGELADVLRKSNLPYTTILAAGWTDWGFVPPADMLLTIEATGLGITSTTTPALNATYSLDPAVLLRMNSNVNYIQNTKLVPAATHMHGPPATDAVTPAAGPPVSLPPGTFPGGATTKQWPDIDGNLHLFPDPDTFVVFATAIADYIAQLNDWAAGGGTDPLPPPTMELG